MKNAYHKNKGRFNIPGFRKVKAPFEMIKKMYGAGVFYEDAVNEVLDETYPDAAKESGLEIVSRPEIGVEQIEEGKNLIYTAVVAVKPEVTLGEYKGVEVQRVKSDVADADIEAELKIAQEKNSRLITVEDRGVENGDQVTIDFDGYVDGKQFDCGKAENYELTLGAGQFIPGFEEQIIGHAIGEEFDVNVKFPEDYHAEELKGKDATFKIKLHEIKMKELPEVDDEFVKDVSEFDTVADYRNDLEKHLLEQRQKAADSDAENQMVDAIIEKVDAVIPEEMIENEIDEMINSFAYRLQSQGLNLETYLKYTGMSTDNLREQYKLQAERQVKVRLGLEKIAELEDIKPTEEETDAEFEKHAKAYEMPVENVKNFVSVEAINADIANQKVIDFIRENAVITEAKPEKKPAAKKKAAPKKKSTKKEEISEEEKTED